jgi:tripartite ATP-independent transporter DctM subunit
VNAFTNSLRHLEKGVLVAILGLVTLLPLIDMIGRPLGGFHIPGSAEYVKHLTLWIAFVGGVAATSQLKHLTLSTAELFDEGLARTMARIFAFAVSAGVVAVLAYAASQVVAADRESAKLLSIGVPEWVSELIMPVTLGIMAALFVWQASDRWWGRLIALAAIPATFAINYLPPEMAGNIWPLTFVILAAALLGAPVFVAMGGIALVLFFSDGTPVSAVSAEVYRLISSPTLPAIPLLTGAGFVLAESEAGERLLRFFRALFGWMPGGMAVMVAAVCAVFTTFTGGSGVTIIALGGLVYPILRKDGYPEGFSLGLVTASGSLGLLFPPSLPVLLYSVVASTRDSIVPLDELYIAGLLPGLLLVVLTAFYGIVIGRRVEREKVTFTWRELGAAAWGAKWELLLPIMIVLLFGSGFAPMVETAAAALFYTVIVQCFITRDIPVFSKLPEVLLKAAAMMGAVLILLSIAMGLTNYLIDAQIPDQLLNWVRTHIHTQVGFLLALNGILLVLGSVLEIYSAIIILAPLIVPMGVAFNVDPVHLGVIFLANLELGFLAPPVGLNLFLSSSRFGTPLNKLYRYILPFFFITAVGVLLSTYTDAMSLGVLKLLGKR